MNTISIALRMSVCGKGMVKLLVDDIDKKMKHLISSICLKKSYNDNKTRHYR